MRLTWVFLIAGGPCLGVLKGKKGHPPILEGSFQKQTHPLRESKSTREVWGKTKVSLIHKPPASCRGGPSEKDTLQEFDGHKTWSLGVRDGHGPFTKATQPR